jgi:hypothetical protein
MLPDLAHWQRAFLQVAFRDFAIAVGNPVCGSELTCVSTHRIVSPYKKEIVCASPPPCLTGLSCSSKKAERP